MKLTELRRQSAENVWITCIFIAIIAEGALRKWLLPTSLHGVAFLAKDLLGICYIAAHGSTGRSKYQTIFSALAYATAGLLFISFTLGLGISWQSAIVTYKNAILWPLIGAYIMANTNSRTWNWLSLVSASTAVAMFVLGGEQFLRPPSSWLNKYAWSAAGLQTPVATFGGVQGVRATGTFSYIAGMSQFAVFSFLFCLYWFLHASNLKQKVLLITGCLAAIGCAVESGSRAPIVLISLATIAALALNVAKIRAVVWIGMLVTAVTAVTAISLENELTIEYVRRWTVDPQETLRRFTNADLHGNYWDMLSRNAIGRGLGQGNGYAIFETSVTNQSLAANVYDDGASIAVYEGGVLGLLAFYLAPCVVAWQVAAGFRSRVSGVRLLAGTLGLVSLLSLVAGVWHDHNAAAFTWLQIGMWFSLCDALVRRSDGLRLEKG
jgi:hypothetical protein